MRRFAKSTYPVCSNRFSQVLNNLEPSHLHRSSFICRLECTKGASDPDKRQSVLAAERSLREALTYGPRGPEMACGKRMASFQVDGRSLGRDCGTQVGGGLEM